MNSQEEKQLFEQYGWTYDFIHRQWLSPSGNQVVTTDQLYEYNKSRETEQELVAHIKKFGTFRPLG